MSTQAELGKKALAAKDFAGAITNYTSALATSQSPLWLMQRANAYQRAGKPELALKDADAALLKARERGRRELMAQAQLRRGLALYALKRYGDARMCYIWTTKLNEKEKGVTLYIGINTGAYDKAKEEKGEDCAECKVTVKEFPEEVKEEVKDVAKPAAAAKPTPTPAPAPGLQPTPKDKIRHEWYQSDKSVSVTIFAKGVPQDKAEISIRSNSIEVSFPTASGGTYDYTVDPLFSDIDAAASTSRITPHKIELTLMKSQPGLKWSTIESVGHDKVSCTAKVRVKATIDADSSSDPNNPVFLNIDESSLPPLHCKAPVYPTSSRTGPKDWDSIAEKEEKNGEGEEDVDSFFKKLYKNATPDQQKAMQKSMQESNGTNLSTDWSEISKGRVEISPPTGLVAKKWGE